MLKAAVTPISITSRIVISLSALLGLGGCAYDGAGYLKPEYNYIAEPDDPEFFLESEFGTSSYFKAKINAVPSDDDDDCLDTKRVAYLQQMDSYLRSPHAPGPWKISAPADKPILIAGQWMRYSSVGHDYLSRRKSVTPATSCPWVAAVMTPRPGGRYRVRLSRAGPLMCALAITAMDGKPVETKSAPNCARPSR